MTSNATLARPVRVAAQLHPQHGAWPDLRAAAIRSDEMGFDVLYTWDHFFPLYGERDGAHFECWTLLAAFAEATQHVEIGALVTCNSYRNPDLLADMCRTLDHVSGGRAILGIGGGWKERDYDEYGYEFGTFGTRLADLEQAMPRIEQRLARLNPPPLHPIPILIAGTGERRTLRIVARHADCWHAGFPDRPEQLEPKAAALRRWCQEAGRDPAEIEWGVGVEPEDLDRFLRDDAPVYLEMGFTQFTLGFNGPAWDVEPAAPWLEWRDRQNAQRVPARSALPARPLASA
jgi:probable F420-dependent oxidoreductase